MFMSKLVDYLYLSWAIAWKDIVGALKNRATFFNILVVIGLVFFNYWISSVRPWDKLIDIVVYDEGESSLFEGQGRSFPLSDGYELDVIEATSFGQMHRNMRYERWGAVIPPDFDQTLASGGEPTLTGYILWVYRGKVAELETQYSEKISELVGHPVRVEIGDNILLPTPEIGTTSVDFHILFATLFITLITIPSLLHEERHTKTLDALLVSPASAGQVVMGKALAGMFYVLLSGGLVFALNWAYITNWGLALLGFLGIGLFSIGLALALGSFLKTPQKMMVWMAPVALFLIVPMVFADMVNLNPSLRVIFSYVPTTALMKIIRFSMSSSVPVGDLLTNLAVGLAGIALVYAVVVWMVRQSDR
jgi:ABC-type Na+ efflux pump permease subunit